MTAPSIRVLILDDHPVVRFGIAAIIGSQPDMEVIGQASRGREAIEIYRKHHPDVTLIDLRLPDISGVQVIRSIRSFDKDARLMVITTYDGDEDIFQAIRAGAAGYIIKGMSHEILLDGIRQVMSGRHFVPEEIATKLDTRDPMATLSEREHQVLRHLVQGKSNKEIASDLGLTEATVKGYVSAILAHLDVADRTQAVVIALRRGLVHL
ncbi:MAG: response regulator transcription factor [Terracidiphilus sp.]|nr:response regulator transcription factor [Terracidiphilus sp.]